MTSSEVIEADTVVVAAGAWTARICAELSHAAAHSLAIGPQRGQIVHLDVPGADTSQWPVVLPDHGPYLLAFPPSRAGAGATREDAGFDDRVTAGGLGGLLAAAAGLAPGLADATVVETRVGFRPVTPYGLPLLGALAEGRRSRPGRPVRTDRPLDGLRGRGPALGEQPPADLTAFDPARPLRWPNSARQPRPDWAAAQITPGRVPGRKVFTPSTASAAARDGRE